MVEGYYSGNAQYYRRLCLEMKVDCNESILGALKKDGFLLNVDALKSRDIKILEVLLRKIKFSVLSLEGRLGAGLIEMYRGLQSKRKKNRPKKFTETPDYERFFDLVMENLRDSLKTTNLIISDIPLSCEELKKLGQVLKQNSSLKVLRLKGCGIDLLGVSILRGYIQDSENLTILELPENKICDRSLEVLLKLLQRQTDLKRDQIFLEQLRSKSYKENRYREYQVIGKRGLKELNLSSNQITDQGAFRFAEILGQEIIIEGISLQNNQIREKGLQALADNLLINPNIIKFDVEGNPGVSLKRQYQIDAHLEENIQKLSADALTFNKSENNFLQGLELSTKRSNKENFPVSNQLDDKYQNYLDKVAQKQNLDDHYRQYIGEIRPSQSNDKNLNILVNLKNTEHQKLKLLEENMQLKQIILKHLPDFSEKLNQIVVYTQRGGTELESQKQRPHSRNTSSQNKQSYRQRSTTSRQSLISSTNNSKLYPNSRPPLDNNKSTLIPKPDKRQLHHDIINSRPGRSISHSMLQKNKQTLIV